MELPVHSFRECGGTSGKCSGPRILSVCSPGGDGASGGGRGPPLTPAGRQRSPGLLQGGPAGCGKDLARAGPRATPAAYFFRTWLAGLLMAPALGIRVLNVQSIKPGSPLTGPEQEASGIRELLSALSYPTVTQCPTLERGLPSVASRGPSSPVTPPKLLCCAGLEVGGCHTPHLPASYPGEVWHPTPLAPPLPSHGAPPPPHVADHFFPGLVSAAVSWHTLIPASHLQSRN